MESDNGYVALIIVRDWDEDFAAGLASRLGCGGGCGSGCGAGGRGSNATSDAGGGLVFCSGNFAAFRPRGRGGREVRARPVVVDAAAVIVVVIVVVVHRAAAAVASAVTFVVCIVVGRCSVTSASASASGPLASSRFNSFVATTPPVVKWLGAQVFDITRSERF